MGYPNNTSMKKIWATKLTDYSSTDKEGIGAIRFEGAKFYKYVKYNQGVGAVAAVAGNFVAYKADVAYTDTLVEVSSDVSDSLRLPAGVLQSAIPNGYFGWIQIRGVATLATALVSGADGDELAMSTTTDGTLKQLVDTNATASVPCAGWALDASAKIVLLMCPN